MLPGLQTSSGTSNIVKLNTMRENQDLSITTTIKSVFIGMKIAIKSININHKGNMIIIRLEWLIID